MESSIALEFPGRGPVFFDPWCWAATHCRVREKTPHPPDLPQQQVTKELTYSLLNGSGPCCGLRTSAPPRGEARVELAPFQDPFGSQGLWIVEAASTSASVLLGLRKRAALRVTRVGASGTRPRAPSGCRCDDRGFKTKKRLLQSKVMTPEPRQWRGGPPN